MDKAQEKIVEKGMYFSDRCQFCCDFGEKIKPYLCPNCAEKIRELGYRKPPEGEPPLLSDEEVVQKMKEAGWGRNTIAFRRVE